MRNSAMTALAGFDVWFMDGVDFAAWPIPSSDVRVSQLDEAPRGLHRDRGRPEHRWARVKGLRPWFDTVVICRSPGDHFLARRARLGTD
jgi:hypothetical protein